ncbi:MAG: hypothetical protein QXQ18_01595 [Candidatus Aenigmatarchaeota archaeon]
MKKKKINFQIFLIITLLLVAIFLYFYYQKYFGESFRHALQSQNPTNICATPPGYTDESWKEHMSHHPNIYKDCL